MQSITFDNIMYHQVKYYYAARVLLYLVALISHDVLLCFTNFSDNLSVFLPLYLPCVKMSLRVIAENISLNHLHVYIIVSLFIHCSNEILSEVFDAVGVYISESWIREDIMVKSI